MLAETLYRIDPNQVDQNADVIYDTGVAVIEESAPLAAMDAAVVNIA